MRSFFAIALFLCAISFQSQAQNDGKAIVVGQEHTINSTILESERQIQISLPEGYNEGNQRYPVLYLLDGHNWFLQAVSLRDILTSYDYTPQFIVVGITTGDSPRYGFFANSDKLLDFLEKELTPFIDNRFRTSQQRMLFAWQFASAFGVQALADRPALFDGWFLASPYPIQGNKINALQQRLEGDDKPEGTLVFATSLDENSVEPGAQELAAMLEEKAPASLKWHYRQLKHETAVSAGHRTTPLGTLYSGLRTYFGDYPNLEFKTLEEFTAVGGFAYVNEYYKQRGEKYGISTDISQEGMFFLVRLGMDADHYPTFSTAMDQFKKTDFLNQVNLGWGTRYAEFCLKHQDPDGATEIFRTLVNNFPESARPLYGLGIAFEAKGDKETAQNYYRQAISKAETNGDSRLESYRQALEKLNAKH